MAFHLGQLRSEGYSLRLHHQCQESDAHRVFDPDTSLPYGRTHGLLAVDVAAS